MQQELYWGEAYAPPNDAEVLQGEVAFASAEEQIQRGTELLGAGALLVTLPPPIPSARGRLGEILEELVERELARVGAPSPYLAAWSAEPEDADARLADQLLRARGVGASGLAIALGTLASIASPVLAPDDSAILRWLAGSTAELPLVLLVDDADLRLLAHPAPLALSKLLLPGSGRARRRSAVVPAVRCAVAPAEVDGEIDVDIDGEVVDAADGELSLAGGPVEVCAPGLDRTGRPGATLEVEIEIEMTPAAVTVAAGSPETVEVPVMDEPLTRAETMAAADAEEPTEMPETPVFETQILTDEAVTVIDTRVASIDIETAIILEACAASVPPPPPEPVPGEEPAPTADGPVAAPAPAMAIANEPEPPTVVVEAREPEPFVAAEPEPVVAPEPAAVAIPAPEVAGVPTVEIATTSAGEPPPPPPVAERSTRASRAARRATAGVPVAGPSDVWRSWAITLSNARGAQPLATFERLFAESYVPLANAIAQGLDDPRALRAYDEFRRSFERSYTDAFQTFGATNRRPKLVMDAFDIAAKHARLANARSTHVLVVDSMRYDLGLLVRDALAREANGVATLSTELLLWSALPTTTIRQLETFARGLDALRAPAREEASESLRGRAAEVVRRFRVGSRELFKLDLVPAMLEGRGDYDTMETTFGEIANRSAEAIARHISMLAPRTLLFILGDHGFTIGRRGGIQTGGASPEEVLVPAQAWLIGDLH